MWRKFRIAILILILATVIQQSWLEKNALDWRNNFYVALYPVNADGSKVVSDYLQTLERKNFEPIAAYFAEQAASYKLGLRRPIELQLGDAVKKSRPHPQKT